MDFDFNLTRLTGIAEILNSSDLKTEVECKHLKSIIVPERQGFSETIRFTYCPKCGVKL